jgi:FAD dependent oxidoreductase
MNKYVSGKSYDVVVVGGGSAGVASAIAAAKNGAKTLLIESGTNLGGEMLSGIPVDGCLNSRGEWITGGIIRELFSECEQYNGYVGVMSDWRALWVVCIDPEVMKYVIVKNLKRHGVDILLYSFADNVLIEEDKIAGVFVKNKSGSTLYRAKMVIDASGDGDIAVLAGAPYEIGKKTELQPVSMVFRMSNVDTIDLLTFVRDHPENVSLGESAVIHTSNEESALGLYKQGFPKVFFVSDGPLLGSAIDDGIIYPCSMLAITPVSTPRKEVSINSTRLAGIDSTDTEELSGALPPLLDQVFQAVNFLKERVPGFENSNFSALAPRIGIRESRRVMGDYVLTKEDVLEAKKRPDGIAKGGHEYDVHGAGKEHVRLQLKDGGSYDIPYGSIIPRNLNNVFIPGRHLSATIEAHSTARVMGTCMAMGEAAGTAAALCSAEGIATRELEVERLRTILRSQGAVLDGTY